MKSLLPRVEPGAGASEFFIVNSPGVVDGMPDAFPHEGHARKHMKAPCDIEISVLTFHPPETYTRTDSLSSDRAGVKPLGFWSSRKLKSTG
jgi:hypothetical protein